MIVESFKNICRKYGIQVYFKGGRTFKNLLVSPKDKDNIKKKSNVIYWFRCDKIDCEEEYIGESSRTFEERYKEHLKAPSPIYEHQNSTGHINICGELQNNWQRRSQYGKSNKGGHIHQSAPIPH